MPKGTKISLDLSSSWNDGWRLEEDAPAKIQEILEPSKHLLVLQKEKRKGKIVTLSGPFSLSEEEAQKVLSVLKKKMACGGAYKEGWMEFQGDIGVKLREGLETLGFRFKKPK